ncbi:MAG: TIGR03619 family F420-dependent LLM class oxidoreductase [Acidimicrobiales bacterium]|nr:MAG: TIGR03619 family F420-dependent LLM class oxidoreductase [Acidimicrobiales bacterium]
MKFGFTLPNNFGVADPQQVVQLGVAAEQLGFDSLWVNHHVINVGYVHDRLGQAPYHDALITLTWLASQTQTATLGTSVLVMPYLHPMVLAKELATLDHLSGGRITVGLGVGSLPEENEILGSEYQDRGQYSNEFIQVLLALWTQTEASFAGKYWSFENVVTSPKPSQKPHPPIVIGGNRAPALRRVAQLGDGWHPLGLSPDAISERLSFIRDEAEASGRSMDAFPIQVRRDFDGVDSQLIEAYEAVGVTDLVLSCNTADVTEIENVLGSFAETFID